MSAKPIERDPDIAEFEKKVNEIRVLSSIASSLSLSEWRTPGDVKRIIVELKNDTKPIIDKIKKIICEQMVPVLTESFNKMISKYPYEFEMTNVQYQSIIRRCSEWKKK